MTPSRDDFTVELPLFSGPFGLLADLLLDQKIDVCDVAVGELTSAFLERGSREMAHWELEDATWFLAVCAILLELKVGRLLPRRRTPETEDELLGDISPDLLYARRRELVAFRAVAHDLAGMMATAALMVPRSVGPSPEFADLYPDVMEKVTPEILRRTAAAVLAPVRDLDLSHVTAVRVTLAEAIAAVKRHLSSTRETVFRDILSDCEARIEVVVRFLALLELYREGEVEISQAGVFGDIQIRLRTARNHDGEGTRRGGFARGVEVQSDSS